MSLSKIVEFVSSMFRLLSYLGFLPIVLDFCVHTAPGVPTSNTLLSLFAGSTRKTKVLIVAKICSEDTRYSRSPDSGLARGVPLPFLFFSGCIIVSAEIVVKCTPVANEVYELVAVVPTGVVVLTTKYPAHNEPTFRHNNEVKTHLENMKKADYPDVNDGHLITTKNHDLRTNHRRRKMSKRRQPRVILLLHDTTSTCNIC